VGGGHDFSHCRTLGACSDEDPEPRCRSCWTSSGCDPTSDAAGKNPNPCTLHDAGTGDAGGNLSVGDGDPAA